VSKTKIFFEEILAMFFLKAKSNYFESIYFEPNVFTKSL